mmetsp:Transcript_22024/g.37445  ORF Transcript_22024/g.37445 Transcript_22024/m.37445 type:complete len:84 (+) Transcript_22024:119-370(+)
MTSGVSLSVYSCLTEYDNFKKCNVVQDVQRDQIGKRLKCKEHQFSTKRIALKVENYTAHLNQPPSQEQEMIGTGGGPYSSCDG